MCGVSGYGTMSSCFTIRLVVPEQPFVVHHAGVRPVPDCRHRQIGHRYEHRLHVFDVPGAAVSVVTVRPGDDDVIGVGFAQPSIGLLLPVSLANAIATSDAKRCARARGCGTYWSPKTRMRLCFAAPGQVFDFIPDATPTSCRPPAL
jgi:hypothetical protein